MGTNPFRYVLLSSSTTCGQNISSIDASHLETFSRKKFTSMSYTTPRTLSNGTIRFSTVQSTIQKISKYCILSIKFCHYIRAKAAHVHFLDCVNSENTCVQYNSMSSTQCCAQVTSSLKYNLRVFSSTCVSSKNVVQIINDLSMSLDGTRQVVSDTSIFRVDIVKKVNMGSVCSNIMTKFD